MDRYNLSSYFEHTSRSVMAFRIRWCSSISAKRCSRGRPPTQLILKSFCLAKWRRSRITSCSVIIAKGATLSDWRRYRGDDFPTTIDTKSPLGFTLKHAMFCPIPCCSSSARNSAKASGVNMYAFPNHFLGVPTYTHYGIQKRCCYWPDLH